MRTLAIIQERMGSTRLPGKVLKPILGIPMLSLLVDRVTADNPLFDPETADRLIEALPGHDFVTNNFVKAFPYGIDLEAMAFRALEEALQ